MTLKHIFVGQRLPEEAAIFDDQHYLESTVLDLELNARSLHAIFSEDIPQLAEAMVSDREVKRVGLKEFQVGKVRTIRSPGKAAAAH